MKKILLSLICLPMTTSLFAQKHSFSLEAGIANYNFVPIGYDAKSNNATTPNGGFSPYIGLNYYLPGNALPLSIGLRMNTFGLKTFYSDKGNSNINQEDNYSYQYQLHFIQLQMPVTYQWRSKHSAFSVGIAPTVYIMNSYDFYSNFDKTTPPTLPGYLKKGISYDFPQFVSASFNLSAAYSYFFAQIGKYKLGAAAFADAALLAPLRTNTDYDYRMNTKTSGDTYSRSATTRLKYLPVSAGIGLILRN